MPEQAIIRPHQRWAHFRFGVIGPLLAAPPAPGELQLRLQELAARQWRHPLSGQWVRFGQSTIERWYYRALGQQDPVGALQRKIRSDRGRQSLSEKLRAALAEQHRQHPNWSYQLHWDNLVVVVEQSPELGPIRSYETVRRYMKAQGLFKRPRRGPVHSPGAQRVEQRLEQREVRSYESEYVHALWHLDFHHGSLRVLRQDGHWAYPLLLAVLDDCSRLCCHGQWYLAEGTEDLCHGTSQAFQKHDLPRALMTDNGSAMISAEFTAGLHRLGILHETTLPYAPFQNGKQESFWGQVEGRLLAMLEGVKDLTLKFLNEATLAWIEMEYNRAVHSELKRTPLDCALHQKSVSRPCPSAQDLQVAFTAEVSRQQRRSDGTFTLEGKRFEVPSRFAHWERLTLRLASWDLSHVYLTDPNTGTVLARVYPLDKARNAQGRRRVKSPAPQQPPPPAGMAPLLQKLIGQYATTGLPAAYLPKDDLL